MINTSPKILALDFDGVICDGLIEYFLTTKRTYCQLWNLEKSDSLNEYTNLFYPLRPVIETGWEMPILLRALVLGFSSDEILQNWRNIVQEILSLENLDKKEIGKKLDDIRDEWIKSDLEGWLGLHRFYPGIVERLRQILAEEIQVYIITTKEGRFVKQLLHEQGIEFPETSIIGKESKLPKYDTIRQILNKNSEVPVNFWFVEDRLEALQLVHKQPDLQGIGLYLAAWGYNTQQTRDSLKDEQNIHLLSLEKFNQDFSYWP